MRRKQPYKILPSLFVGLALAMQTVAASPLHIPDLLGYWPLDGNAVDASGNGKDGVVQGNVTPTADRHGNNGGAMAFDDTGWILPPRLDFSSKYTFSASAWIQVTSPPASGEWWNVPVEINGPGAYKSLVMAALVLNADKGAGIFWYAYNDSGDHPSCAECWEIGDGSNLKLGDWVHIAGVWEQTGVSEVTASLYVNGTFIGSRTSGLLNDLGRGWGYPIIGGSSFSPSAFQGNIDDVAIFDRALTPTEIEHLAMEVVVPIPAAAWLFGTGLIGFAAVALRRG